MVETSILEAVNESPVPRHDMMLFVRETSALKPEDRDYDAHAVTAIRLFSPDSEKIQSVLLRLTALSRLLDADKLPGWARPKAADGSVLAHGALFAAAAEVPLELECGEVRFDEAALLQRAFQLARDLDETEHF